MSGMEDVSKPRREVLPYGAVVLERLLKKLDPSEVRREYFDRRAMSPDPEFDIGIR